MGRLQGKHALITGASRGIGLEIARAFAREGAHVVISSRKQESLDAVGASLRDEVPGATVDPRACHVGHIEAIEALMAGLDADGVAIDVLVCNAGTNPYFGPLIDAPWPAWRKTFEVNLEGPFELARQVARRAIAAKTPASIQFTSSVLGMRAAPLQGVYGATKAALISLTQTLAVEWGRAGVRVNAIAPGLVETRLAAALVGNPHISKLFTDRTALGRHAQPEEIAGLAVFLGSDESSYVTGQVFPVDGGYTTG